ncbi:calponin homology domain-containing protein DDB_G0272472-like [Etheostoma cragini]|uniref:calponin homology domain-containing protein DDB_G0272472-like n=1 Tax=Etheostoma cragini TaxID=417921 RepID=UPI00155EB664|nr:calponin homology domain-containing protein DDB_G0272472-like [Etheostoma cragini]
MEFNSGETEPQINFYLSYLEKQVRLEQKDSEATLTQCESEGRVHLIIREDLLADLLDQLQKHREGSSWGHDTELMQKEMCDLDRQTFGTQDLKVEMEEMKGKKEALKKEVDTQKMKVCKERQKLEVKRTNVELELESFLDMERAQAQELQDKLSKIGEALRKQEEEAKEKLERSQASHRAQLDEALAQRVPSPPRETQHLKSQMGKISNRLRKALKDLDLQFFISEDLKIELEEVKGEKEALKKEMENQKMDLCKERQMLKVSQTNVELELESCLEMERAQAHELKDKLSMMEEALIEQEEGKTILERSQASHRAQL